MGYEVLVGWILIAWSLLERSLQPAMRRPVPEIEAIRQIPAGRSEYLPPILISISDPLQRLSRNRQLRRSIQKNLLGVISYPDALLRFPAGRLAVS
jgi:hypothetical protein